MPAQNDRKVRVFLSTPSLSDNEKKELFLWMRREVLKCGAIFTYDWMLDEEKYQPQEMFKKVSDGIYQADLVIAELSFSSTGVGQQVGMALTRKIPVLGFVASWKEVPRKFTIGAEGGNFRIENYTRENFSEILKIYLKKFGKERFEKFNFVSTSEINQELEAVSSKRGISKSQLLRQIIRDWFTSNS